MIGQTFSHYRILEKLGEGGMGEVYLAEDTSLDRKVALKFLNTALQQDNIAHKRLLREAKSAAALDHPYICHINEVVQTNDGQDFICMEFVQGQTLREKLADGPLPLKEVLQVGVEVAEALEVAHSERIIHRDLKPANIMLTPQGHAKVMDFGLAKRLVADSGTLEELTSAVTREGATIGTLAYMSPEQLKGESIDTRSDLFSLGIVLYEVIAGFHPFLDRTHAATAHRIISEDPISLTELNSEIPEQLELVVDGLLEKDPDSRCTDAKSLLSDLKRIESSTGFTPTEPIEHRQSAKTRKGRVLLFVSAAALIVLAFLIPRLAKHVIDWLELAPLPKNPTVAILPFTRAPNESRLVNFSDGLHEMVSRKLLRLSLDSDLTVVPPSLVRDREVSSPAVIERRLGANLALIGHLEYISGKLEAELSLVEGQSGRRLRSRNVKGAFEDTFSLEATTVEAVLTMLNQEITVEERRRIVEYGTQDRTAYHFYLNGIGDLLWGKEGVDRAAESFRKALTFDRGFAAAQVGLGLALLEDSRESEDLELLEYARQLCESALEHEEDLAEAYICLGEFPLMRNQLDEAVTYFERAHNISPESLRIIDRLELLYYRMNEPRKIEKLYQGMIHRQPRFWLPYSGLAVHYYYQGKFEEAVPLLRQSIEIAPNYPSAYNTMGVIYAKLHCWQTAGEFFEKASQLESDGPVITNMATAYFFQGRYPEAIEQANQAFVFLKEDRENLRRYLDIGNLAEIQFWSPGGSPEKAREYLAWAIESVEAYLQEYPGDVEGLGNLALYKAMNGEHSAALEFLQLALATAPDHAENLYKGSLIFLLNNDSQRCLEMLERSLNQGIFANQVIQHPGFERLSDSPHLRDLLDQFPNEQKCP